MTATTRGMLVGAVLALTALQFGFGGLLLVALALVIGYFVGRFTEGELDVRGVADALRGRRSS